MLSVEQGFTNYKRVWVILQVFRLPVVHCWTCTIPELRLVLLPNHSFLLWLVCESTYSFSFVFLVGTDVVLRGEARESRRMGLAVSKTIFACTWRSAHVGSAFAAIAIRVWLRIIALTIVTLAAWVNSFSPEFGVVGTMLLALLELWVLPHRAWIILVLIRSMHSLIVVLVYISSCIPTAHKWRAFVATSASTTSSMIAKLFFWTLSIMISCPLVLLFVPNIKVSMIVARIRIVALVIATFIISRLVWWTLIVFLLISKVLIAMRLWLILLPTLGELLLVKLLCRTLSRLSKRSCTRPSSSHLGLRWLVPFLILSHRFRGNKWRARHIVLEISLIIGFVFCSFESIESNKFLVALTTIVKALIGIWAHLERTCIDRVSWLLLQSLIMCGRWKVWGWLELKICWVLELIIVIWLFKVFFLTQFFFRLQLHPRCFVKNLVRLKVSVLIVYVKLAHITGL